MNRHRRVVRTVSLVLTGAFVLLWLPGCLLTLGAPLTRAVQPGTWTLEGGGGLGKDGDQVGPLGYGYVGRALGEHFEIGASLYTYPVGTGQAGALFVPLKWDPVAHQRALHWLLFGGPAVFGGTVQGGTFVAGTGLSLRMARPLETYLSVSTTASAPQLFTAAAGLRLDFSPRFELGAGLMYSYPSTGLVSLSATTWLGGGGRR